MADEEEHLISSQEEHLISSQEDVVVEADDGFGKKTINTVGGTCLLLNNILGFMIFPPQKVK